MSLRRFFLSFPIFLLIFLIQEALVTQMRLPLGGFSLILVFSLTWSALCTPELGALTGFGAGLLMDLSQTSPGPMGHWMITMIIGCSLVSFLSYGDDHLRANPLNIVFLTVAGALGSQFLYAVIGLMLGQSLGSLQQVLFVLLGSALWCALITPLLVPLVTKIHILVFGVRSI